MKIDKNKNEYISIYGKGQQPETAKFSKIILSTKFSQSTVHVILCVYLDHLQLHACMHILKYKCEVESVKVVMSMNAFP